METKNLTFFIETARLGSFAAVARTHDLDPSSVSRAIALLEADLGVRLFQRTTRKLTLTEAGEIYLRRIIPLIEELERAGDEAFAASSTPMGTLRLTTSVAFGQECIVPLIDKFQEAYPSLKLELLMTDAITDLVAERVDLAIRLAASVDADTIVTKLMNTRYRVCASPDYIGSNEPIQKPSDLSIHSCLLFTLPDFRSRWLFRDPTKTVEPVPVKGDIVISNALAIKEAAIKGLGPTLLANWMIDKDIADGRLVNLFPSYDVTATSFDTSAWILYPSRAFLPNKVRVAIDFLRTHFSD